MAILRKVTASSLFETLVATVLLILIFTVASLAMEGFLASQSKAHSRALRQRLHALEYAYRNKQLALPYLEVWKGWEVRISDTTTDGTFLVEVRASHPEKQTLSYTLPKNETNQ